MRATSKFKLLTFLFPIAFALPAAADDEEVVTDELPAWARAEIEDARAWEAEAGVQAAAYGAELPSPEEVMYGRAPAGKAVSPIEARSVDAEDLSFDDFREGLAPHGRWVDTPSYGLVFVPTRSRQVAGWRPYLYGQWAWTRYGWTWVSDEPFGWATYHYGRWGHQAGIGWFWVPGYVWGPAWVAWRQGPDAVGWAPLYPGYVRVSERYPVIVDHWVFVGHRHFHAHPVHRHWHRGHIHRHYHRSHWSKNWRSAGRVYTGPPRRWMERRRGGRIHELRIVHARRPAPSRVVRASGGRRVELYRPSVRGVVRPAAKRPPRSAVRAGRPAAGSGLSRGAPGRVAPKREAVPSRRGAVRKVEPAPRSRVKAPSRSAPSTRVTRPQASPPRSRVKAPSRSAPSSRVSRTKRAAPSRGSAAIRSPKGGGRKAPPARGRAPARRGR